MSVRLSVSLSVCHTPVLSLNGYTYPQSFHIETEWQYSDGDHFNGGKGVWKNHDFRPISRFISQMMQDRATVTMEGK